MSQVPFILGIALLVVLAGGCYLFYKRRKRSRAIAEVLSGNNLIGRWTYTAAEWQLAVADEFSWANASAGGGEVFISPTAIYIKSTSKDHLIELNGNKVVTHASYRGTEGSPLKIRVRWKVIERSEEGTTQRTKYYKEDYRIPVPLRERETVTKVAKWFTENCEKNRDAYANVVGADEAISIFGDDSF